MSKCPTPTSGGQAYLEWRTLPEVPPSHSCYLGFLKPLERGSVYSSNFLSLFKAKLALCIGGLGIATHV